MSLVFGALSVKQESFTRLCGMGSIAMGKVSLFTAQVA